MNNRDELRKHLERIINKVEGIGEEEIQTKCNGATSLNHILIH